MARYQFTCFRALFCCILVVYVCRTSPTSIMECYPNYFSDQLCVGDTTIEVTDVTAGVSLCNMDITNCCPDPADDCIFPVQESSPAYYNETLVRCNHKQSCDGLIAQRLDRISLYCPGVTGTSDYVTIHYLCLTDAERLTTITTLPSSVSFSSYVTSSNSDRTSSKITLSSTFTTTRTTTKAPVSYTEILKITTAPTTSHGGVSVTEILGITTASNTASGGADDNVISVIIGAVVGVAGIAAITGIIIFVILCQRKSGRGQDTNIPHRDVVPSTQIGDDVTYVNVPNNASAGTPDGLREHNDYESVTTYANAAMEHSYQALPVAAEPQAPVYQNMTT